MKPQCTTAAQCLKELARVMEQFGFSGINSAVESKYVKSSGVDKYTEYFTTPTSWQFAIAEVEGKPVFVGDELYGEEGLKFVAMPVHSVMFLQKLSWNPPEPETTTIELKLTTVKRFANIVAYEDGAVILDDIAQACKKALEKLK